MGSQYPPGSYDEATLSAMESAFRNIWKTLAMRDPCRDTNKDDQMRASIVGRLMRLVAEAVTSADELQAQTLRSLAL
jgi:hypothetical protein